MTLEEAILHAEEVAEEKEKEAKEWHENQVRKCKLIPFSEMDYTRENECKQCAKEHRQLTKWLKELKQLREQEPCEDCISRKAVLDLVVTNHTELNEVNVVMYSPFCKDIKQLPPVTPKAKSDVLDKIRAEIEEATAYEGLYGIYIDRAYVLQILDKYRESEE